MKIKSVETFTATIYVGLRKGYSKEYIGQSVVETLVQNYVDSVGLCVTIKEVKYIYTSGQENGLEIGLINYPRFPSTKENVAQHALEIAKILLEACHQYKISIVMPDRTLMLEREIVDE